MISGVSEVIIKTISYIWEIRMLGVCVVGLLVLAFVSFSQHKREKSVLYAICVLILLVYGPSIISYLAGLSSDSLAELERPSWQEAKFFISTVSGLIESSPARRVVAVLGVLLIVAGGIILLIRIAFKSFKNQALIITGAVLSVGSISLVIGGLLLDFDSSRRQIEEVKNNYSGKTIQPIGTPKNVRVVVYIGESTSIMNMQLYGYVRPTTPKLVARVKSDEGMIVFNKAFSTHVHTSPSLMDALGLSVESASDRNEIIYKRKYESIVDVLNRAGISTALISNQGRHGTWNIGNSAVFREVAVVSNSIKSVAAGNNESRISRPYDGDYFNSTIGSIFQSKGPQAIFLHSYAGHGPYLQNIPADFHSPVDQLFSQIKPQGLVGDQLKNPNLLVQDVENYDSAIRYVDHVVDDLIHGFSSESEPVIFLYFSDHGDSPWSGRGHDSSRVLHEMVRVPLLIYFNDLARKELEQQYKELKAVAASDEPVGLNYIAGTVLSLFGIEVDSMPPTLMNADKERRYLASLIIRELGGEATKSAIFPFGPNNASIRDDSDIATRVFRASRVNSTDSTICYHRSNNLARARRATLVTKCLEIDIAVANGGTEIEVFHPPALPTGLQLATLLQTAAASGTALWLDGKDLDVRHCQTLAAQLSAWKNRLSSPVLIELSPFVDMQSDVWRNCAAQLRSDGMRVSYYVPPQPAEECAAAMSVHSGVAPACSKLQRAIQLAVSSGMFTDLSFDFSQLGAVQAVTDAKKLKWNTWGVQPENLSDPNLKSFGLIIVDVAGDPNHY